MTVRFKFRSSVGFDSVDIDGRSSISVRDLRGKIVQQKNLKICDDFDLVISHADTGTVYENEDFSVPDGSSVIIKRVPARRSSPSDLPCFDSVERTVINYADAIGSSPTANVELENFDDFGVDLCPAPDASLDSDVDIGNCISSGKRENGVPRYNETATSKGPNIEPSDLSEAISRGTIIRNFDKDYDAEGNKLQAVEPQNNKEEHKLDEVVDTSTPIMLNVDLPAELRCSLCNTIFKGAVMIPCCQHSFCDKCIRSVLMERKKCPKCSSTKCQVVDLLPNVSLRQAIEHFLESQVLISGSDNNLPKYAPDGESGIHAKEVSCAVSIRQREPLLPHSPSATGKGSNQVMTDSVWESRVRNQGVATGTGSRIIRLNAGISAKSSPSFHKIKQMKDADENHLAVCPEYFESAQGRLEPKGDFQKEANSTGIRKKGSWVNTSDGSGSFFPASRYRKGDRTCYMCGSPDHLIRDCPAASSPYTMRQTGDMFSGGNLPYGPHYWQGAPFPHVRPFGNLYGTPGMMPFDPTMVSVTPFAAPPYMSSMYAGMPIPCGFMMGGMVPPMVGGAERPFSRSEFVELQDTGRRHTLLHEHPDREQMYDADDYSSEVYHCNEPQRRSSDRKQHSDREDLKNHSDDDDDNWRRQKKQSRSRHSDSPLPRRSNVDSDDEDIRSAGRKYAKDRHFSSTGRDSRAYYSEKSIAEIPDMSDSSNHHSREWHGHHRKSITKKYEERIEQCGSDSNRKNHHHRNQKETSDNRKRVGMDTKEHSRKHNSFSETGLEPSTSSDRKRQRKEKESNHRSRHSRHMVKATDDDELKLDRWEMVDSSDQDERKGYHHHKRKRNH